VVQIDSFLDLTEPYTCVALHSGKVRCWGANGHAFLGLGSADSEPHDHAAEVVGIDEAAEVATGGASCVVKRSDGSVWCWGANESGNCGAPPNGVEPVTSPVQVMGIPPMQSVASGSWVVCGLSKNGEIWCWGSNFKGELGQGSTDADPHPSPVQVRVAGESFTDVAIGIDTVCAATQTGHAYCWGNNSLGNAGSNPAAPPTGVGNVLTTPARVSHPTAGDLTGVVEVGVGYGFACARRDDGRVACWGDNIFSELGITPDNNPHPWTLVPQLYDVVELGVGGLGTCARLRFGTLSCWGNTLLGQFGYDEPSTQTTPNPVAMLDHVSAVAASWQHTCAVKEDGTVRCWGSLAHAIGLGATGNQWGELGTCTTTGTTEIRAVAGLP
jgi:alpha-tubulin suppressor-like RCC1 family protein